MMEDNPIRVRCPVCGKVFQGIFGASLVFDHFNDKHKDKNLNDYLPIEMELIK
jgi:hypothetical protein